MSVYLFGTCKENVVAQCRLLIEQRVWWQNSMICRESALRNRILFASPEAVHRPRLDSFLHCDPQNICLFRDSFLGPSS